MSSENAFLAAWREGVTLAGRQWFGGEKEPRHAASKWDLTPLHDDIVGALGYLSTGEAAFLASMYSFFNPTEGGKMLANLGVGSPGRVASVLDDRRRRVISELLLSYPGW